MLSNPRLSRLASELAEIDQVILDGLKDSPAPQTEWQHKVPDKHWWCGWGRTAESDDFKTVFRKSFKRGNNLGYTTDLESQKCFRILNKLSLFDGYYGEVAYYTNMHRGFCHTCRSRLLLCTWHIAETSPSFLSRSSLRRKWGRSTCKSTTEKNENAP